MIRSSIIICFLGTPNLTSEMCETSMETVRANDPPRKRISLIQVTESTPMKSKDISIVLVFLIFIRSNCSWIE